MGTGVGRRLLAFAALPVLVLARTAAASSSGQASWATPEIRAVTAAGLMGAKNVASFRADDPLTAQALETLAFDLQQRVAPPEPEPQPELQPVPAPTEPVATDPTQPPVAPPVPAPVVATPAPKQVARPDA